MSGERGRGRGNKKRTSEKPNELWPARPVSGKACVRHMPQVWVSVPSSDEVQVHDAGHEVLVVDRALGLLEDQVGGLQEGHRHGGQVRGGESGEANKRRRNS